MRVPPTSKHADAHNLRPQSNIAVNEAGGAARHQVLAVLGAAVTAAGESNSVGKNRRMKGKWMKAEKEKKRGEGMVDTAHIHC